MESKLKMGLEDTLSNAVDKTKKFFTGEDADDKAENAKESLKDAGGHAKEAAKGYAQDFKEGAQNTGRKIKHEAHKIGENN